MGDNTVSIGCDKGCESCENEMLQHILCLKADLEKARDALTRIHLLAYRLIDVNCHTCDDEIREINELAERGGQEVSHKSNCSVGLAPAMTPRPCDCQEKGK